jgi:hypothetical protein
VCVPGHIGITGNTAVDAVAKVSVSLPISNAEIFHTDFKPLISSHVINFWATMLELGYQQQAVQNTARNQIICCQPSAT